MKLKKLVALFTAGALCLGMSLTAFAADNSREKLPIAGNGVTEDGVVISSSTLSDALANGEITEEEYNKVVDTLGDPEKIKDVIKEDLQLPSDAKVAVLGVMNYEPEGTVKDGSTVTFALSPSTAGDLKEGETIAVLHLKKIVDKDGNVSYVWETKVGTVRKLGNGVYVDVELDDFSPVAFVKVMSNGDVVKWNAKGEVVSTTSTTTKKVSPKTGE
ncbi:MAG: hypothetical protein HFG82_02955 [Dorea sp.]|jgi:hypothetical protein|nr:hypothetical protein [Dorea sp.]